MSKTFRLDYTNQDLRNGSFRGQNLRGANFDGSDIRGCNFQGAVLTEASFEQAKTGQSYKQILALIAATLAGAGTGWLGGFNTFYSLFAEPFAKAADSLTTGVVEFIFAVSFALFPIFSIIISVGLSGAIAGFIAGIITSGFPINAAVNYVGTSAACIAGCFAFAYTLTDLALASFSKAEISDAFFYGGTALTLGYVLRRETL